MSYDNQVLSGVINGHNAATFLHPPKKVLFSSSVWPTRECTWILNWKESLLFALKVARVFPIPTGRIAVGW